MEDIQPEFIEVLLMTDKTVKGLVKRGDYWHIDKRMKIAPGSRIRESTGETDFEEALIVMGLRIEEIKRAVKYGERPDRSMYFAAQYYLKYKKERKKKSIKDDAYHLKMLLPFIGDLPLRKIHNHSLKPFISARKAEGVKASTINRSLEIVRGILHLAAGKWTDEYGLSWIANVPVIEMLEESDSRPAYPLHTDEQKALLLALPSHLVEMTTFKLNTGLRESEVCKLRWSWEQRISELNTSIFIIPAEFRKPDEPRVVVLNDTAKQIINGCRGRHDTHVFSYKGKQLKKMNTTSWKRSRVHAALNMVKANTDVIEIKESSHKTRTSFIATIKFWRKNKKTPLIACYSLALHEQDRLDAGMEPIRRSRWFAYDTQQLIRYKALIRAVDNFWPQYSEFARTRVHDIRHTCGRRLRAARVPLETRAVLLGHATDDITTHYSAAEYQELIDAVQLICNRDKDSHVMNVTRVPYSKPKYGRRANRQHNR